MNTPERVSAGAVTQFAVLDALLAGAYESGMPVEDALRHGDFGIGCCDRLGGEVVIVDGMAYACTVDGPPHRMTGEDVLPFADVCAEPSVSPVATGPADLAILTSLVEAMTVSRNLFHSVRVDGEFRMIRVRATRREHFPLRPLAEVADDQVETVLREVEGTLVGFWAPSIYQGIAVAGLHVHFLAADRHAGGHVLDLALNVGALSVGAFARFNLVLPTDAGFLASELTHDDDHRIVAVEGGAARSSGRQR
ncbi:acetolactate decarboxylase [Microbacterium sp. SLBN-154]|uniref:acetolactate decarboxylase n=1 Tax=Microbacterium sp. SLBN-154 TaxID=2768458 RepID=UPI00114FA20C|nr:acetolactate decarboxylase [Microbacterium sp. SLBN-154]TQK19848.1 acetolactate decarboxylase [Microbacterium sp. SLBN-154]